MRTVPERIVAKREGHALGTDEIRDLVCGHTDGTIPDYQMSALAMAVYFQGMNERETTDLTVAMRDSGEVLSWNNLSTTPVDKHSTGGVGDKISICLAPMVAACGVPVPMISGRGLGHTGGTLDKLEAIPGMTTRMDSRTFRDQVSTLGCALAGQSNTMAPADKKLYALRDVTGTVESVPLITASILSKKLAEGIGGLVLDVKVGRGAFMKSEHDARTLANALLRVSAGAGTRARALLTNMDTPLGHTIGNAIETREALQVLHGRGPRDVTELTLELGAHMLLLAGIHDTVQGARAALHDVVENGAALDVMARIVQAQGGDPAVVHNPQSLDPAGGEVLTAPRTGHVVDIHPRELGLVAITLGAGRERITDSIDPAAGLVLHKKLGDPVGRGEPLVTVHTRRPEVNTERILGAIHITDAPPPQSAPPLIIERMEAN